MGKEKPLERIPKCNRTTQRDARIADAHEAGCDRRPISWQACESRDCLDSLPRPCGEKL